MTDTDVKLRVRDQVVCVSRQCIVESPWRLSLMFDVPWEKMSGHYYVNADPESFRKVVSLLEG
ncbi:hypothetical protein SARC_08650 [Sphaeroforma arctica JP610]|uniref:Uncharacterized protein n=1 Tax=Sphaeroforma arctica JP610 TaxID=667725 RepID=A0A0L0FQF1_9EUKA|nr:hypothetical protein SARC_08650 [Sphaeroforma arctica JP610]KNC78929.1 hypothetical protein SARC_08650 [Sphaeroforma arctica JP610]|eukprot:XP_014152831.1 hypothetical protein SARC_08650 [Sphaeroforma arctica JP610]